MAPTTHVGIVYARSLKAHHGAFPLRAFNRDINDWGIELHFANDIHSPRLKGCSVLCFVFSDRNLLLNGKDADDNRERFIQTLNNYRAAGHKIVLLDDHDTSGAINPRFVDAADMYAKGQLLKDRSLYQQPMYQRVAFKDYYHTHFNITDERPVYSQPLSDAHIRKLILSWNYGLIDWNVHNANRLQTTLRLRMPNSGYKVAPCYKPLAERTYAVSLRVGLHKQDAIVHHHRRLSLDALETLNERYELRYKGRVSYSEYVEELCNAVIAPSPYGIGEVCYRDFEAFKSGALLLKPNMEALETWPKYYEENVTYIPYALDYSDYTEKIETLMTNPSQYQSIATEGQERWLQSLRQGRAFAEHFHSIIQLALV